MSSDPYFTPRLFDFLRDLERDNTRGFFQENKARYVADVQQPVLRFIADFAAPLRKISPHFDADPRPVGGSMFRIHRDVRFSRDKSPYKTHVAAHFRHRETSKDAHGPGFYFHLEPGAGFIGGGIWLPAAPLLKQVRDSIAWDTDGWRKARRSAGEIEGEQLSRAPQGYDPAHPFIDDLKRKSFYTTISFTEEEVCAPEFLDRCVKACRSIRPFVAFLTDAAGVDW